MLGSVSEREIRLRPLTIVQEGDEYIVGSQETGVFIALPEVGVVALEALRESPSLADAAASVSAWAGEDVNLGEFVETLRECGFVLPDDEELVVTAPSSELRLVSLLFGRVALWTYGLLLLVCVDVMIVRPNLRPSYKDAFFLHTPALSVLIAVALSLSTTALHEGAHWIAARAEGVGGTVSFGRRWFLPVFETDLTGLWGLPRERRYGPMLAGMAANTLLLTAGLAVRLAYELGVGIPTVVVGVAGFVVLLNTILILFQFLLFLRTDLYAVAVSALGCRDLYRVSILRVKERLFGLPPDRLAELRESHPRDLQVSRWFAGVYVVGAALMAYLFVVFFIPSVALVWGWTALTLSRSPVGSSEFLQALPLAALSAVQIAPLVLFVRERVKR